MPKRAICLFPTTFPCKPVAQTPGMSSSSYLQSLKNKFRLTKRTNHSGFSSQSPSETIIMVSHNNGRSSSTSRLTICETTLLFPSPTSETSVIEKTHATTHLHLRVRLPSPHPRPAMRMLPRPAPEHQQSRRIHIPASQLSALQHGVRLPSPDFCATPRFGSAQPCVHPELIQLLSSP